MSASAQTDTPATDLSHTVAVLLAGGQGARLHELTRAECKPAVHFTPGHRIVDFTMANAVRSGLTRMVVATQHCPGTLTRHLTSVWNGAFAPGGLILREGPAVAGPGGYRGTADALRANIDLLDAMAAREVIVLSGDHVYAIDYAPLIAAHRASGADLTVSALVVPVEDARDLVVVTADGARRITRFEDKPRAPRAHPDHPGQALVGMDVYVASWPWLRGLLLANPSITDFRRDVVPYAVAAGLAFAWQMPTAADGDAPYWRHIGTLDAYRRAVIDFGQRPPPLPRPLVPGVVPRLLPDVAFAASRFSAQKAFGGLRLCVPRLGAGDRSRWTVLDETILMPGARVSPGVRLTRCIVAPGTAIPDGLVAGEDRTADARWFRVTDEGTTLITTAMLARRHALRGHLPASPRNLPMLHSV